MGSYVQAEDFIKYRTQAEQLQLLTMVVSSKAKVDELERDCGKEEAGDDVSLQHIFF